MCFWRTVGCVGLIRTRPDQSNQLGALFRSWSGSARLNYAAFDWCPVFHQPCSELQALWFAGEVISPCQLEHSDKDERRRRSRARRTGGDGGRDHAWGTEGEKEIDGRLVALLCTQNTFVRRLISQARGVMAPCVWYKSQVCYRLEVCRCSALFYKSRLLPTGFVGKIKRSN